MTFAPSASMWSRCSSIPRRSPPKYSTAVFFVRALGQLVPRARHGPAGRLDAEPVDAKRSGKIS
jgi:hypothetical protein